MKKSIVAIAFLLLCPFYGVRAQERPFFDLSGKGWHLWQDKNAAWQTEDIYLTLEEARKSPVIVPTCLLYTSPSPRDPKTSRMPSSA